jgi:hypothetical protein
MHSPTATKRNRAFGIVFSPASCAVLAVGTSALASKEALDLPIRSARGVVFLGIEYLHLTIWNNNT